MENVADLPDTTALGGTVSTNANKQQTVPSCLYDGAGRRHSVARMQASKQQSLPFSIKVVD